MYTVPELTTMATPLCLSHRGIRRIFKITYQGQQRRSRRTCVSVVGMKADTDLFVCIYYTYQL